MATQEQDFLARLRAQAEQEAQAANPLARLEAAAAQEAEDEPGRLLQMSLDVTPEEHEAAIASRPSPNERAVGRFRAGGGVEPGVSRTADFLQSGGGGLVPGGRAVGTGLMVAAGGVDKARQNAMQLFRAMRGEGESDEFQQALRINEAQEEANADVSLPRRAGAFTAQIGAEVFAVEAALAAAVAAGAPAAIMAGPGAILGRKIPKWAGVGIREGLVGGGSETAVGYAETGDASEALRRGKYGTLFGAGIGAGMSKLLGRGGAEVADAITDPARLLAAPEVAAPVDDAITDALGRRAERGVDDPLLLGPGGEDVPGGAIPLPLTEETMRQKAGRMNRNLEQGGVTGAARRAMNRAEGAARAAPPTSSGLDEAAAQTARAQEATTALVGGDASATTARPRARVAEDQAQLSLALEGNEGGFLNIPRADILESRIPTGVSPELRRALDNIDVGGGRTRLPSTSDLIKSIPDRLTGLRTALQDRSARVSKTGRRLAEGQNIVNEMELPEIAARIASGAERQAEAFLEMGTAKWEGDNLIPTGRAGLTQILAPAKGRLQELRGLLYARRTAEVAGRKIETGLSPEDARRIIADADPELMEAAQGYSQYMNDVLEYYFEATGMPPEMMAKMREMGASYMPLNRVFAGDDAMAHATAGGADLSRLKGSERVIVDPVESAVDATRRMVRAGNEQRLVRSLAELSAANPTKAAELGIVEVARSVDAATQAAAENLVGSAAARGQALSLDEAIEIVRPLMDKVDTKGSGSTFTAYVDGVQRTFRMDKTMQESLSALSPEMADGWLRAVLGTPASTARAGITQNPIFQFVNGWRDNQTAAFQSQYGYKPFVDWAKGFRHSWQATWHGNITPEYREFAQAGGGFSGITRDQTRRGSQEAVERVLKGGETVGVKNALGMFARSFEEAARVAEFTNARKSGATTARALMAAQEISVNFQQSGASMGFLNGIIPFLNAQIQGGDALMRTLQRSHTTKAGFARFYGYGIGGMAIPTAILWAANRDDQEIQDLRKTPAGALFWYMRLPGTDPETGERTGTILRVPKGFVYGQLFGTGTEAILDRMFEGDKQAGDRWAKSIRGQVWSTSAPTALRVPGEIIANYDMFTQAPVVSPGLEGIEPQLQYDSRTPDYARTLAKWGGYALNPIETEHLVRGFFGTLPDQAARGLGQIWHRYLPLERGEDFVTHPAPQGGELAFIRRFIARSPSLNVEPVQTFWEGVEGADEAKKTYDEYIELNDREGAIDLVDRRRNELGAYDTYQQSRALLSEIRTNIDRVERLPNSFFSEDQIPRRRKREMIDNLLRDYIRVTRLTNDGIDAAFAEPVIPAPTANPTAPAARPRPPAARPPAEPEPDPQSRGSGSTFPEVAAGDTVPYGEGEVFMDNGQLQYRHRGTDSVHNADQLAEMLPEGEYDQFINNPRSVDVGRNVRSSELGDLAPAMQPMVGTMLDSLSADGFNFRVSDTYRSPAAQVETFERGRFGDTRPKATWTLTSAHNDRRAADFVPLDESGQPLPAGREFENAIRAFQKAAKETGFRTLNPAVDPFHVEMYRPDRKAP